MNAIHKCNASKTNLKGANMEIIRASLHTILKVIVGGIFFIANLPSYGLWDRQGFLCVDVKVILIPTTAGVINSSSTNALTVSNRHRSSLID